MPGCLYRYTVGRKEGWEEGGALWKTCLYPLSACWKPVSCWYPWGQAVWLRVCVGVRDGVAFHRSQMFVSWWKVSILPWDRNHSCLVRSDVLNHCLIFMDSRGLNVRAEREAVVISAIIGQETCLFISFTWTFWCTIDFFLVFWLTNYKLASDEGDIQYFPSQTRTVESVL